MRFMVIEQFRNGDPKPVYRRLAETGRRVPDGVTYLDSWVDLDHGRCFQLMDATNRELLDQWTAQWKDLIDFEVVEVLSSQEAARLTTPERDLPGAASKDGRG
jgi:hypothetical protein